MAEAWMLFKWAKYRKEQERDTKSATRDKEDHSSAQISKACCNFHLISPDDWCGG